MKSISLSKFLERMTLETDEWVDKVADLAPEERE